MNPDYEDAGYGLDYFIHILSNHPLIDEIPISNSEAVNKYVFLQKIYQNLPFAGEYVNKYKTLTFKSIKNILFFIETLSKDMDNDIWKLFSYIQDSISDEHDTFIKESKINYDTISAILLKLSILLQNIYNYKKNNSSQLMYSTSSYTIDNVLCIIENLTQKGCIYKYKFEINNMNAITKDLRLCNRVNRNTDDYFFVLYLEFLVLTFNAYNNELKEREQYEW